MCFHYLTKPSPGKLWLIGWVTLVALFNQLRSLLDNEQISCISSKHFKVKTIYYCSPKNKMISKTQT